MHFVYILHSASLDRFYIGESADPLERFAHHNAGHQRFTKRASDWVLVFQLSTQTREEALDIEQSIQEAKSRKSILRWIEDPANQITTIPIPL